MSGVPRSQRLLAWESPGAANSPAFVSPGGFITLVKSLHVENKAASVAGVVLTAVALESNVTVWIVTTNVEAGAVLAWEGWFVLNPGDAVYVGTNVAGVHAWLSGAVLAGSPQFPPAELRSPRVEPYR